MSGYEGFLGTSNVHFAHKYGVPAHGTYAHESVMAMQALYGPRLANKMWMKHWSDHFEGLLGTALTDTFTTDVFLRDFGPAEARLFDGVRQDSGDPEKWGDKMLSHYDKLNIPVNNKRFVFSDGLDTDSYIELDKSFRPSCQPIGGIGTHFTNDVGVKPLNIVIKLATADFGQGPIDVVKLSDNEGKHTGNKFAIEMVTVELGIK
jgi:nicotinate phosphoribosyltransferase